MFVVTLKQMISKHYEWERDRVPHIPFPTRYMLKCMFTLYLLLFLVAFFMYQIFIIVSIAGLIVFVIAYYLFVRLLKQTRLCLWKFHLFFSATGAMVAFCAVFIRSELIEFFVIKGW